MIDQTQPIESARAFPGDIAEGNMEACFDGNLLEGTVDYGLRAPARVTRPRCFKSVSAHLTQRSNPGNAA